MRDRVSRAAVHLHVDDQLFDLIVTCGFIQTDEPTPQHGHAHAHDLSRAEVSVRFRRIT
jgi:hypothetical protein